MYLKPLLSNLYDFFTPRTAPKIAYKTHRLTLIPKHTCLTFGRNFRDSQVVMINFFGTTSSFIHGHNLDAVFALGLDLQKDPTNDCSPTRAASFGFLRWVFLLVSVGVRQGETLSFIKILPSSTNGYAWLSPLEHS